MPRHTLGYALATALTLLTVLALPARAEDAAEEPAAPPPDEIVLKNGSRILGTVVSARDGVLILTTDALYLSLSSSSWTPVTINMRDI